MYSVREQIEKLKPYVASTPMNIWGPDLLQPWKTQINIHPISETNHKIKNVFEKNVKRYYQEQSQTIQIVQRQGTKAVVLSKVPTTLPLKCLTKNQCRWNNDL